MIQWALPLGLWGLLSLGVIVALHFFLRQPPGRMVSSTILYRRLLTDVRQVQPRSRLRWSWLLLLQLAAALFLSLAIAGPSWLGAGSQDRVVLLIDGSASMGAEDVQPNRFGAATQDIRRFLQDRNPNAALLFVSDEPRLVHDFTREYQDIQQALADLEPTLAEANWNAALELAEGMLRDDQHGEILIWSDGVSPTPSGSDFRPAQWNVIGEASRNAGITALEALPSGRNTYDVMVRVGNFGNQQLETSLELSRGTDVIEDRLVSLAPGEEDVFFFRVEPQTLTEYMFSLAYEDYLPADNQAALRVGRERLPRTALLTAGNVFLERALLSYPEIRLFVVNEYDSSGDYDLWVFDSTAPEVHAGKGLYFKTPPQELVPSGDERNHAGQLRLSGIHQTHPLARFMNWDGLRAVQFVTIPYVAGADPLLTVEDRVLAAADGSGQREWIFIGLDLLQSNFPLSVEFPLFIGNAIDWLVPPTVETSGVLSAQESNIAPRRQADVEMEGGRPLEPALVRRSLATALVWVALALVLIEWVISRRRRERSGL